MTGAAAARPGVGRVNAPPLGRVYKRTWWSALMANPTAEGARDAHLAGLYAVYLLGIAEGRRPPAPPAPESEE